jgi:hypothetical protein
MMNNRANGREKMLSKVSSITLSLNVQRYGFMGLLELLKNTYQIGAAIIRGRMVQIANTSAILGLKPLALIVMVDITIATG